MTASLACVHRCSCCPYRGGLPRSSNCERATRTEFPEKPCDQRGPPGLMAGAASPAIVSMEVLTEEDEVAPMRGGGNARLLAMARAVTVAFGKEELNQVPGKFGLGTRPKPIEIPSGLGHTDDRYIQVPAFHHCLQCWEDLLVSKIARSTEENKRIRVRVGHRYPFLKQPLICLPVSPSDRRTRNAWQTGACSRILLHHVS